MVRKMLKAFIRVTADKTHFAIDVNQDSYNNNLSVHIPLQSTWVQHQQLRNFFISQCTWLFTVSLHSNRYVRLAYIFSHDIISQILNLIKLPLLFLDNLLLFLYSVTLVPFQKWFYNIPIIIVYPSQCAWPQLVKLSIYFTTLMFALHLSHQPLEYYAYSNYLNINEHQPFNTYRSKAYILLVYQRP